MEEYSGSNIMCTLHIINECKMKHIIHYYGMLLEVRNHNARPQEKIYQLKLLMPQCISLYCMGVELFFISDNILILYIQGNTMVNKVFVLLLLSICCALARKGK